MWHSCGAFTLEALFERSEPRVLETFRCFERMARELAEIRVIPQKTRIVFQTRTRFAGGSPRKDHFEATFIFFRRHPSTRFSKVMDYGKWFGHHARLMRPEDVDEEVREWLIEALEYGNQAHQ